MLGSLEVVAPKIKLAFTITKYLSWLLSKYLSDRGLDCLVLAVDLKQHSSCLNNVQYFPRVTREHSLLLVDSDANSESFPMKKSQLSLQSITEQTRKWTGYTGLK